MNLRMRIKNYLLMVLVTFILLTGMLIIQAKAKDIDFYYVTGTIRNYTVTITYNDGISFTSQGIEVHDDNGNVWILEDDYNPDIDGSFKDGEEVIVKMGTMDTKSPHDDIIKEIQKAK